MTLRAETVGYIRQALLPSLICAALTSSAIAADENNTNRKGPGFWRTSQLYERCTSSSSVDLAACEAFIMGVAATMQDDQVTKIPACIPYGTSSQDVMDKVVGYLRTRTQTNDMRVTAVSVVAPVLAIVYNCTPGEMPKGMQKR